MKPSWNGAPAWAKWLAQDASGAWFWYQRRPLQLHDRWWPSSEGSYGATGVTTAVEQPWPDTLEARPCAK